MLNRFFNWLERKVESFPTSAPAMPQANTWGFIRFYSRPFLPLIFVGLALSVAIAIIEVRVYAYVGTLIDLLGKADRSTFFAEHGSTMLIYAGLALLIQPGLSMIADAVENQGLRGNFAMRIRWLAHRYMLRQSMEFFHNEFAGRVATKVMQAALGVRDVVMKLTQVISWVVVFVITALASFIANDWRLAIPMVVWIAAYGVVMRHFVPQMGKLSERQADMRSLVTGRIVDTYTNIPTVKLFAHAAREDDYAREGMGWMLQSVYDSMRVSTKMNMALNALNGSVLTATAGIALWLWSKDAITVGAIAFSVGLVYRMLGMAHWMLWEVAGLFEDFGVVKDGIDVIARQHIVVDAAGAKPLDVPKGKIAFSNLHFNYGKPVENDREIIAGLDLVIKPGEKVGLVGRSGAGKSTLASLLLRFYDVGSGTITIDDQDISKVKQESLRAAIGVVTQDTSLMHRSVHDNIRYGRPDSTEAEIAAAAEQAHASEFIATLVDPNGRRGMDAHVGERGVKLSGGQRQRVAIARVLLKNAPILILDEATSALDSEVEAAIQENLNTLMEGKTVIAVAHRLSTIAAMDRLVVMDKGRIVEEGTHAQLVKKRGGIYAALWARQSGGFLIPEDIKKPEAAE
ncbi:ABC transporter ATP-binding protein [Aestuariivirga litoralis]|uniref:ABC transporter ATP-binding protein n=1 Tax=Aestuariivirga litoralis TaxID=2650924 RepID=UPI0018C62FC7|nr:ABC transporter ATP-binding protein [Aestuariivirga litoralis]MBG1231128.1 ABC transporter ATP-binding protein [Aestuariivirga litoralis]